MTKEFKKINIPSHPLNDGNSIPLLGLGVYKTTDEKDMHTAVDAAYRCGYRLFDTASVYGNEELLGNAIRDLDIPREKIFLTSKVWNNAQRLGDVSGAFQRTLDRLGTAYIDLYLIHWPVPGCTRQTWRELIRLKESGLARSIGVSNFSPAQLECLEQETGVVPVLNQIECHPLWRQRETVNYCQSHGIQVQAYAPLARGAYKDREILIKIGEKYGKTAAQTGLRWLIQRGISVIPKSVHPSRIVENADIFDFALTEPEMTAIDAMDEGLRTAHIPQDLVDTEWAVLTD
ncbi:MULTISPECIES: aldo/keto reductase [unclassified Bilifractor]|uniref:aldo/keto reductase n=1 Tax=unclassified Bilifractor TaxID=2815795 RepID=UPI003F8FB410